MSAENILEALTDNIVVDKSKCIFCGHCAEKCVLDNIRINRAPCSGACPLGLNVQGYVQLIARGQEDRARQLIADVLPFAPVICRICDHPCEHACNRRDVDGQAVSINGLKRYLFAGMPDGELCPAAATGKKVAIVGAGPAGMLAAYDLRRAGHDVAVYDAAPKAGGLLRSVLPLWKLPDSVLDGQIAMLEKGGVTFHLGQRIDKAGLEALQAAHDAVILALGAGEGRASGISGEQLPGTLQALDFLTRVRSGQGRELSGNVVIVGGGYVALDCAQAAVRCGAEKVLVVYRRTVDAFKADREDLEKARALGVRFAFTWAPERITDAGGLTLYCRHDMAKLPGQCVDYPDFDPDEERAFPADTIIWAIGQQPDRQLVSLAGGVSVDPVTLQAGESPSSLPGTWWAGLLPPFGPWHRGGRRPHLSCACWKAATCTMNAAIPVPSLMIMFWTSRSPAVMNGSRAVVMCARARAILRRRRTSSPRNRPVPRPRAAFPAAARPAITATAGSVCRARWSALNRHCM